MNNSDDDQKNYQIGAIKKDSGQKPIDSGKYINILVIEPDSEIRYLYKQFFNAIAAHVSYTIVNDIRKIRKICNDNNNTRGSICNLIQQLNFDTVIIDLNIGNHDGIEVAKEVLEIMPRQRIIFTTTVYFDIIKAKMISQGLLSPITILQKPFKFSDLLSIISPSKGKFDRVKLTDHVLASYDTIQEELMDAVDFIKKGIELDEAYF